VGETVRKVEIQRHEKAGLNIDHCNGEGHVPPRDPERDPERDDRLLSCRREEVRHHKTKHDGEVRRGERDDHHDEMNCHDKHREEQGNSPVGKAVKCGPDSSPDFFPLHCVHLLKKTCFTL